MLSTSMGVQFEVNDLDAAYELIGTSNNYSFQYKLGKGRDLVDSVGGVASEVIPLKGNYGSFEVKVFAISDIGIRSEFVLGNVSITPPSFDETFTFNNLRILENFGGINDTLNIEKLPISAGDELIVSQNFAGKNMQLAWELIPPNGHPLEGQSVDSELLSDTFFSGIIVNIKNSGQLISQKELASSESLASSLLTNDVSGILNNYRDFSLNLNSGVFEDLNLQRNISVELVAVDSFGGRSTGTLSGYNPAPVIQNFNYSLRGSDISFSWLVDDLDYTNLDINVLAVEKGIELLDSGDFNSSSTYFESINETVDFNKTWESSKNVSYKSGDMVLWQDNVYKSLLDHASSYDDHPVNGYPWENIGPRVSFELKNVSSSESTFSNSQLWGYEYYYSFQPFDDFGSGDLLLLGENGILQVQGQSGAALFPYESIVQIGSLRYIEDGDDFVFNWNVVDQDGNAVDLNQYKFAFKESSLPTLLGLSGSLYDIQSNEFLTGITDGTNGIGLRLDDNGNTEIVDGLASTKIFDTFRFTRELNNQLYGVGGFPSNYYIFDNSIYYKKDDHVSVTGTIYKSIITQTDSGQKTIRPEYYEWENYQDYQSGDCVVYDGDIYELNDSYGPAYSEGIFDFETSYSSGDLVVAPVGSFTKFYDSYLSGQVDSVISNKEFTTDLTNIVDNQFQALYLLINNETRTIVSYDGNNKAVVLDSDLSLTPQNGDVFQISGFEYQYGQVVVHNNRLYKSNEYQSQDNISTPGEDSARWRQASTFSQVSCEIYECLDVNNFAPNQSTGSWQAKNPLNVNKFNKYISGYAYNIQEWSDQTDFAESELIVYSNDIWSGIVDSGPNSETGIIVPGSDSSVWVNNVTGQDILFNYNNNDIVYYFGTVYRASQDNPAGAPIMAVYNPGSESLSTYSGTEWFPYWQQETIYDDVVFGHIGIPESGNRSVGIELGIVDSNNQVFSLNRLTAYNQQPSILPNGFNVDSLSETTKIKFNFNYAFSSQEKTTKVNLYRSSEPNFEITGADGLPYETIDGDSTLVKVTLGAADATFGENITQIVDSPPIPKINGIDQVTGYYYKILPFDDFGSGDLFGVNDNQGVLEQCLVYPKNYSTKNPNGVPGPVYRTTKDDIPGPVVGFNGNTSFENYFLNWFHPSGQISTNEQQDFEYNNNIPNDLSHYEVWMSEYSGLQLGSLDNEGNPVYLKNQKNESLPADFSNTSGYRRIETDISSTGPIPIELQDPASGITNATRAFTVSANGVEIETSYPGKTNDTKYFWVRAVDHAGNKSPFTGASGLQGDVHNILGLRLTLGAASATDIDDFELNMTETFGNTIALVPNNPFENNNPSAGSISWGQHYLFNDGTGYVIEPGSASGGYVWWDKNDENKDLSFDDYGVRYIFNEQIETGLWLNVKNTENSQNLIEWEINNDTLKNVFFSGVEYKESNVHPANNPIDNNTTSTEVNFNDGDFIIARNTNGIATPVYHAFANALIGTANIADAAIKTAHVNDLSADKIRAGTIDGHDIQVTQSVGQPGSIRTAGFTGVDYNNPQTGFLLSGDGSFSVQQGGSSIDFDDGKLTLRGSIKQTNGEDYNFIDVNVTPSNFNYVETNNGYEYEPSEDVLIDITFRNTSTINVDEILIKAFGVNNLGAEYVVGDISLDWRSLSSVESFFNNDHLGVDEVFKYISFNTSSIETSAQLQLTSEGFDSVLNHDSNHIGESMVVYVKSSKSSFQKKISIGRIIDGKIGNPGPGTTYRGVWEVGKSYIAEYENGNILQPIRGDVVKSPNSNNWYICIDSHVSQGSTDGTYINAIDKSLYTNTTSVLNTAYWKQFGSNFESVATNLLLTDVAYVGQKLIIGDQSNNPGSIISNGDSSQNLFIGGFDSNGNQLITEDYNPAGFRLEKVNQTTALFDVGGPLYGNTNLGVNSYLRFSSSTGKVEISSASFNGSINIGTHDPLDFQAYADDDNFASFVGGGYNNNINTITIGGNSYDSVGCGIIAGAENTMTAAFSMIGAGYANECNDNFSFIAAGYSNKFSSTSDQNGASFIGGGQYNEVYGGSNQAIIAGDNNKITYFPPERYFYGDFGPYVSSDDNYLLGGFAFGIGEEWKSDKVYNTGDIVYISYGSTYVYDTENKYWLFERSPNGAGSTAPPMGTEVEGSTSSAYRWYKISRSVLSAPWYDRNYRWIAGSWLCDATYVASNPDGSRLDPFDGRFPIKRHIGWFFLFNIGGQTGKTGWGYVVVNDASTKQNPELWIFIDTLDAIDTTNGNAFTIDNSWCLFEFNIFRNTNTFTWFYNDTQDRFYRLV